MRYKKKPIVIEAIQWTGNNDTEVQEFAKLGYRDIEIKDDIIEIETLEGLMKANLGDYIIKGIKGELYPCKPEIFKATYEMIGNPNKL